MTRPRIGWKGRFRRVSPISVCLGEGRLTQSTADLQPEKRELARAPAAGVPSARTEVYPQLQLSRAPSRDSNTGCSCPCTYAPSSESGRKKNQGRAVRQEPRHEGCPPGRGPVLKSAPCDDGRAYQIVLLFERPVVGKPAEQNNVFDPPAWAGRQQMHAHGNHATLAIFPKYRPELSS